MTSDDTRRTDQGQRTPPGLGMLMRFMCTRCHKPRLLEGRRKRITGWVCAACLK